MVGKTTLLDSIFWAAYGYLPKWGSVRGGDADAVIKRGHKACSSTVSIEHAGNLIEITRSRPVKLTVKKNGVTIEGKTADLDKQIPFLIGMTDAQFLISVYMPQKRKMDSFFSMGDNERTQLLSTVAGLQELDTALIKVKAERSKLSSEVDNINGRISVMQSMIEKLPSEVDECALKVNKAMGALQVAISIHNDLKEPIERDIPLLESSLSKELQDILFTSDQAISEHDTSLRQLKEKYTSLNNDLATVPQVPSDLLLAVESARDRLSKERDTHRLRDQVIAKNERIQQKINEELDRMEAAASGNCSHCSQDLPEVERRRATMKHFQNAKNLEADIAKTPEVFILAIFEEAVEKALITLNNKKNELSKRPSQLKLEMDGVTRQMKSEQDMIDVKRTSARREREALTTKAEAEISKKRQLLKDAKTSIDFNQADVDSNLAAFNKLESRKTEYTDSLNENKIRLASAQGDIDELLDLMDLFGSKGFRTVCFEDLIARISDRAGQLLSIMTDGLYSTRIEQAGETGKGEHRVMLRPIITRGGIEVPTDDLSGGAEATVTLAYDVSISEAISENSPLFLDEALDGLDSQGKGEAIRLIEEVSRTRPVFLIDHTNEIKSSVQNIIQITYKNDTSSLENSDEDSDNATAHG